MFIDMHAHVYPFDCPKADGWTQFSKPEEVLRLYDAHDIEYGILMPLVGPEVYLPQSNEDILWVCRQYPDRFIPFCNLDPRGVGNSPDSNFMPWLEWYRDHGVRGVGEFMPNLPFDDPLVLNFFRQVEEIGFPLTFDISGQIGGRYGLFTEAGLGRLEYCLKSFPRLNIICHGPAFWSEIGVLEEGDNRDGYIRHPVKKAGAVVRLFRTYPNVWADLSAGSGYSAMARDPEFAANFLEEFQDRLMYGTDVCSADQIWPMDEFLLDLCRTGKLTRNAFEKIASLNAKRLLGLP